MATIEDLFGDCVASVSSDAWRHDFPWLPGLVGQWGIPKPLPVGFACSLRRGALSLLVAPGKLSRMNLHSLGRDDVQRVLAEHGFWLSCYRDCLYESVQEAGGYWEAPSHSLTS